MLAKIISKLLHKANSNPPGFGRSCKLRQEFYAMKVQLLERYGTEDGFDVQHIPGKRCWTCNGTGFYESPYGDYTDVCNRCFAGWFKSPKWVTLKRTRFGEFVFHTPQETTYTKPEPDITRIEGYVEHKDYPGRQSELAALWLFLLTGRFRWFWRMTIESRPCGFQWHPFLVLSQVACSIKWKWIDWTRTCHRCERWSPSRMTCKACSRKLKQEADQLGEIPF